MGIGLNYLADDIRVRGGGGSPTPIISNFPQTAIKNVAYTYTPATFGGVPGYTYALTGTLPTGLSFHTGTGVIDGTPTGSTATGLTITVTDSTSQTFALGPFTLTVAIAPAFTNSPATTGTTGTTYTYTPTVSGGTAPLVYSETGTLPAGLSLNTSTGVITGTPTTAATYSGITETVTDAVALSGSVGPFTITISAAGSSPVLFTHNFLTSPSMPTGLALSRSTTGTYFNSSGVMQTAAIDAARFENTYNGTTWNAAGLLVEEQRTNSLQNNYGFNFSWTNAGPISRDTADTIAPDGATWDRIFESTTATNIFTFYQVMSNSAPNTYSIFAKAQSTGSKRWLSMSITPNESAVYDVVTKAVTQTTLATASIVDVGNGWCRCIVKSLTDASNITPISISNSGTPTFEGNGTVTHTGDGVSGLNAWAASVELGKSFPTSSIQTGGSAVTRSADLVSASGTLATQLAAGPSVWEMQDQATGTISRVQYAAGAFDFPTSKLYRSFGVYPTGTNTAPYTTVGGGY